MHLQAGDLAQLADAPVGLLPDLALGNLHQALADGQPLVPATRAASGRSPTMGQGPVLEHCHTHLISCRMARQGWDM